VRSARSLPRLVDDEPRVEDDAQSPSPLFSGDGHRTFEIIDALESDAGKPVVTGNPAAFWKVPQLGGVQDRIAGLGRLLTLS